MADFSALKTSIQNYIKENGNEEITGNLLQQILLSMVTTLGDSAINDLVAALNAEIANRGNADTELGGSITTLQGVVNGIKANVENGYVYAGIATPSTTPVSGKVFYLALTAGTYNNFGSIVVPQGINILKYNGSAWSLDSFLGLDDAPTQGSSNFVKSGGVLDSIIKDGSAFDLSAYNNGTTYADLSAALTALNALPAAYKKGGMSMKYVQSSDNKYVQYFLTKNVWSASGTDWQKIYLEEEIDSIVERVGVSTYSVIQSVDDFLTKGKQLQTDGSLYPDSNVNTSDFIPVDPSTIESLHISAMLGNEYGGGIFFYNENKQLIGYVSGINQNWQTNTEYDVLSTDIPNGTKYFIVSSYIVGTPAGGFELKTSQMLYGVIGNTEELETENKSSLVDAINEVNGVAKELSETELSKIEITNYALIATIYNNMVWSNGERIVDVLGTRSCTSILPLDTENDIYGNFNGGADVIFFNEQKQYISALSQALDWENPVLKSTFPLGAKYVAFNWWRGTELPSKLNISVRTTFSKYACGTILKYKGQRPIIRINVTDSQIDIFNKLCDALVTTDCDVYWENGTYTFDDIYIYMRDTAQWQWTMGLPVGGNCRYYFNNSTIISDVPAQTYQVARNIFDAKAVGQSFEMYDGILINKGGTYCVHDDANGATESFRHIYKNLVFVYQKESTSENLSQCVGCGFGVNASYIFDSCVFSNGGDGNNDCSFGHGYEDSTIKLNITNCYFAKQINLMNDLEETTNAIVIYSSNSSIANPSTGTYNGWKIYSFNNETRS